MNTIAALFIVLSPVNPNAVEASTAVITRQADARAAELADERMVETLARFDVGLSVPRKAELTTADVPALVPAAAGNEQVGG